MTGRRYPDIFDNGKNIEMGLRAVNIPAFVARRCQIATMKR